MSKSAKHSFPPLPLRSPVNIICDYIRYVAAPQTFVSCSRLLSLPPEIYNLNIRVMFLLMFISSFFTFVELNCENLFDCTHDSLKNDTEFLPDGSYRWTRTRYWRKLNHIGQALLACGDGKDGWQLPDMVALCEVENDTVMRDLTRRSLLRKARYEYVMTDSPDERGIDVALMYSPFSFALINHRSVRPSPLDGMRPTRDLLYACGLVSGGDTLHVIVTHMPSRRSGERITDRYREHVARYVVALADSIRRVSPEALIIVAGDFNEYSGKGCIATICDAGFTDVSDGAVGRNGAKATYRYRGGWGSLDHVLASRSLARRFADSRVEDSPFLIEDDERYGGVKPRRNYLGPRWLDGFSDHLPLVVRFDWNLLR